MKLIDITGGELNATTLALSEALGNKGAEVARNIRTDPAFVDRVAKHMLAGAPEQLVRSETTITVAVAQAIMGNDRVFGPYQISRMTGIELDQSTLTHANVIPYKLSTLVECKKDYLLVYGLPTTIHNIVQWSRLGFRLKISDDDRFALVTDVPTPGWYLVSREAVKGVATEKVNRQASLVEIYLALSLHKEASPRHYFFRTQMAFSQLTAQGGEVLFGLGAALGIKRYQEGECDCWAVIDEGMAMAHRAHPYFVSVILPDDIK